jgi:hypothetical protein
MISKERVKISLEHQEPDRVPLCEIWVNDLVISAIMGRSVSAGIGSGTPHYQALRAAIKGRKELKLFMRKAISDHFEFCEKAGLDIAMVRIHHFIPGVHSKAYLGANGLFDYLSIKEDGDRIFTISHPEKFWSKLTYDENMGTIMETDDAISKGGIDALRSYVELLESRPVEITEPFYDVIEEMDFALNSEAGKRLFVLGTADICFPMFLHFSTVFLEAMAKDPELIDRYMSVTTNGVLSFLKAQLDIGVDGIIGTNDLAYNSGLMFSIEHFNRFIAPHLKKLVEACHGYNTPYIKHLDGNINAIVSILVEEIGIDALHAIEPVAQMDIFDLKQKYGQKISLWGNLDCGELLTHGSGKEIDAQARRIITHVSPGGGHGFSSSNAIHKGVPPENFYAMTAAVKKYGKYPIDL